jgi:CelD/BcsL family acetyltransferase involved in cellulose biosynthesis
MKRAEEKGTVSFQTVMPSVDRVDEVLNEAESVEVKSWKGQQGSALACDSVRRAFFRRYAALAARQKQLHVSFLRIGKEAAAMQIAVQVADRFWLLKVGYDDQFARCSPGILLTVHTIQYAAQLGLKSYEFLGKVEPWTAQWSDHAHECISLRLYPYTISGMAALGTEAALAVVRKAAARFHK